MHEVGYCEALLPVLDRRARGRPVAAIGITAGVRHRLVGDVMAMAWQLTAADGPYARATTVLEEVEMTGTCRDCGVTFQTDDTLAECPGCGAIGPALSGGDEFMLGWVQYAGVDDREVAEAAVAGPSPDDHQEH